ncbi:MAG: hypothetical protein ACLGH0_00595 [Thermoanaerobaculia bacterium]
MVTTRVNAKQWINFVRLYGPIPTKDNLYDENLRRQARRKGIPQILFTHPFEQRVVACFDPARPYLTSTILTGTAGDGKTFLCGRVWERLGGSADVWAGEQTHCEITVDVEATNGPRKVRVHVLRDLSAWVPVQGATWPPEKRDLLLRFCASIFSDDPDEMFLIAANDGQLSETFRRLLPHQEVERAKDVIEDLLVTERETTPSARLQLFNLSRGSSAELLGLALDAFLTHPGWAGCQEEASAADHLFGAACPIRRNYELLGTTLLRSRLGALLELCDQNGLHVPVRQILILLSNAVLGHPEARDHLMTAEDVPRIVRSGTRSSASVYSNIFGGNLPEHRRVSSMIFQYLERFQIGRETSNRFDNLLIFGESHEHLEEQFRRLVTADSFYGADAAYAAARQTYIEGGDESPETASRFLDLLVQQRRALFFRVPDEEADDLRLWDLTVFRYGGEYLAQVLAVLRRGAAIRRSIVSRIIRGTNRIFTGMLITSDHELFVASSASLSQARVSRFLEERISVTPRYGGERIDIVLDDGKPTLAVALGTECVCKLRLTLTRYEYLSRVAEGAMPTSFSKECFEDVMAFKSQLMRALESRGTPAPGEETIFRILTVDDAGAAREERIGVQP